MASYRFTDIVNTSIPFSPSIDFLLFDAGYEASQLFLLQEGTDVRVQYGAQSILLQNITLSQLQGNQFTFADGGLVILGSIDIDTLTGSALGDSIYGLDGSDTLDGQAGSDIIYGGEGDDTIEGSFGNDTLYGENGNDTITDNLGSNVLDGGAGDDTLTARSLSGSHTLLGGAGVDTLNATGLVVNLDGGEGDDTLNATGLLYQGVGNPFISGGTATLFGGAGTDSLNVSFYSTAFLDGGADNDNLSVTGNYIGDGQTTVTLVGGSGDDNLSVTDNYAGIIGYSGQNSGIASASLDGGDGNDKLTAGGVLHLSLTGGAGVDSFILTAQQYQTLREGTRTILNSDGSTTAVTAEPTLITDFTVGVGGDVLDYSDLLRYGALTYDGTNPFGSGFLSLVQDGADTLLKFDADGATGNSEGEVVIARLQDVTATSLLASNFNPNHPLDGSPPFSLLIPGDDLDNILIGGSGDDTIYGYGGNDTLDGQAGSDSIYGGEGDDRIEGNFGNDTLYGEIGNDTLTDNHGSNFLDGGAGDDNLTSRSLFGNHTLLGGTGVDELTATGLVVNLDGGEGDDYLYATGMLYQGGSNLLISGGTATLSGGAGTDSLNVSFYSTAFLDGGADNDNLSVTGSNYIGDGQATVTLVGGSGDDNLSVTDDAGGTINLYFFGNHNYGIANASLDGGDGNDKLTAGGVFHLSMTGGAGVDSFILTSQQYRTLLGGTRYISNSDGSTTAVTAEPTLITDFTVGVGGDVLDYSDLLSNGALTYDGTNPFGSGFLSLVQDGADTLLEFDADGTAGTATSAVVIARLQNVTASSLLASNFNPNFDLPNTNQPAILGSALVDLTETDAVLSTSGVLSIADVDSPATFLTQTDVAGTYGVFNLGTDGAWTYLANSPHNEFVAGATYTDNFVVHSADGTASSVTVNILGSNDAPVLTGTIAVLPDGQEDQAYTVTATELLQGFTDADGDVLFIQPGTVDVDSVIADNGTVVESSDGTYYTITPNANYQGPINLYFAVSDGTTTTPATVSYVVLPVNDAPELTDPIAVLPDGQEDQAYVVTTADLLQGFTDADGDVLFIQPGTVDIDSVIADNGIVVENNDGTYTITPNANYFGVINLYYTVTDGVALVPTTVSYQVLPVNDAPALTQAPAVLVDGLEDSAYTVSAANLLLGYTDVDNDALSVVALSADNGVVLDNGDGSYTITPTPNFAGRVNLSYGVSDGQVNTPASQSYTLAAVNDAPIAVDDSVTLVNGIQLSGSTSQLTSLAQDYLLTRGNTLVDGLGSASDGISLATFGENHLVRNDDGYSAPIEVASVFANGINFFGNNFTSIYVNNNGSISFANGVSQYTPSQITAGSSPIIAPFWADVDTRGGALTPTFGGTSTGSNLVYYDMDAINGVITVTWDDVGYYSNHTDKGNAFQMQLVSRGGGDFDIVLRYESINWTTGDASSGSGGLAGTVARVGYSAGDGNPSHYYELPQSGNQADILAIDEAMGNSGKIGTYLFSVRNGAVVLQNNVLNNDSDADGDVLTISEVEGNSLNVGQPVALNHGTFTLLADGRYTYEVNSTDQAYISLLPNQSLIDTVTYSITDGHGAISSATLNINVAGINDVPVFTTLTTPVTSGNEDSEIIVNMTDLLSQSNASDVDGTVDSFVIKAVNSGVLRLGVDSISATAWDVLTNNIIDATNQAFWTPDINANGILNVFTVVAKDNAGLESATAIQATVLVNSVNDSPALTASTAVFADGLEDQTYTVTAAELLQGFTDADGDVLFILPGTLDVGSVIADNGTVVDNNNGIFTITPNANYFGVINLYYTVTDGVALVPATLSYQVLPVNDAPVLTGPIAVLPDGQEDQAYTVTATVLLQGFTDADGDVLFIQPGTVDVDSVIADNGIVVDNNNGTFTITPNANYHGPINLYFAVSDGTTTTPATVSYVVLPVNDAPELTDPIAVLPDGQEDQAYVVTTADLLQGFTDADGDVLFIQPGSIGIDSVIADNGTVVESPDGTYYTITPNANYFGVINLYYTVTDGVALVPTTVSYQVLPVNDAPALTQAPAVLVDGLEDTTYTVSAANLLLGYTDVDNDALSVVALSADNGVVLDNGNGTYTITPFANFNGVINLSYSVSDGFENTLASQSYQVLAVNDAPELTGEQAVLAEGLEDTAYIVSVADLLLGYTDVDNDPLSVIDLTADHGSVTALGGGLYSIQPTVNYNGPMLLSYSISDGYVATPATLSYNLLAVNDAPELTGSLASLADGLEGSNYLVSASDLLTGYSDVDGDLLSVVNLTADHGSVLANEDGTYTITPALNYAGTVTLSYEVNDGTDSAVATQSFELLPANHAPVLVAPLVDQAVKYNTASWSYDAGSHFTDTDAGDTLTFSASLANGAVLPAWLSIDAATGLLSGTPALTDIASLLITVVATDLSGAATPTTFTVAATAFNAGQLLVSTAGNDTLVGNTSNDTASYAYAGAGVTVSLATTTAQNTIGAGSDTLTGIENLIGSNLNDRLTGNTLSNTLFGGTGVDTLVGGGGNDTFIVNVTATGTLEDTVTAGTGLDTLQVFGTYGGAGATLSILGTAIDNVDISATGSSLLNLTGSISANNLLGNAANNSLSDGGVGGLGDTLVGGLGNDTYTVNNSTDSLVEALNEGTDTVNSAVTFSLLTNGQNVENLTLTGIAVINGTGNSLANVITGNASINTLSDGGIGGADTLSGAAGNDTYLVNNTGDSIIELAGAPAGTDLINSTVSFDLNNAANVENLTLLGVANLNATGNAVANSLTGNTGNNSLTGGAGVDTLIGGGGNDTYVVNITATGTLEDTVTAGAGIDTVKVVGNYTGVVRTLIAATTIENYDISGTGSSLLNVTGNVLSNQLTGNAANNLLSDGGIGGLGDTLTGGAGNDTYTVTNSTDILVELSGEGTDLVNSTVSFNLLTKGANVENITLTGATAINATGNDLNNTLTGNTGINSLSGGKGDDTYFVQTAGDVVTEVLNEGRDVVNSAISFTLGANVEELILSGTLAINGTGNSLANVITGNTGVNTLDDGGIGGSDTLTGGAGNDIYVVNNTGDSIIEAVGTVAGATDLIRSTVSFDLNNAANVESLTLIGVANLNAVGNSGANTLTGNTGNNVLTGGAGVDSLIGGGGNDTYVVNITAAGALEDAVTGNTGIDTLQVIGTSTNATATTLTAAATIEAIDISGTGSSLLNITGNALANTLTGNAANNILNGGAGTDTLIGGGGNDTYTVDNGSDVVTENAAQGTDLVNSSVTYTLAVNVENLTLTGTTAINGTGNNDNNILTGNSGINTLLGNDGNDILIGKAGNDNLTGGAGVDTFWFDTTANATTNRDTITDFVSGTDKLQFSVSVLTTLGVVGQFTATDQRFWSNTTGLAHDATDRLIYNTTTGVLNYDSNGNVAGGAVQLELLGTTTHPGLAATDLWVA